jgi:hypothetical protein
MAILEAYRIPRLLFFREVEFVNCENDDIESIMYSVFVIF